MTPTAPVRQIGRFQFSISHVVSIEERRSFWGFGPRRFLVNMANGKTLRLTAKEKAELDAAVELHTQTCGVLELIQRMQQNNRPAAA